MHFVKALKLTRAIRFGKLYTLQYTVEVDSKPQVVFAGLPEADRIALKAKSVVGGCASSFKPIPNAARPPSQVFQAMRAAYRTQDGALNPLLND